MTMGKPLVTVGLVTWNGERYMRYCMEALLAQTFTDFSLIVLDNGSHDNTLGVVREYEPQFAGRMRIIANKENVGFAKGHNHIFHWSDSKYNLVLNQDTMLDTQYLERCLAVLEADERLGAVSGIILKWQFDEIAGGAPEAKTTIIDSFGLQVFRSGKVIEQYVGEQQSAHTQDANVFGVSGTMPIYRKQALEAIRFEDEYYDEDFFSYKEDVDCAYRLRRAGWEARVIADAVGWHDRTAQSTKGMTLRQAARYRSQKHDMVNMHSYKNHLLVMYKNWPAGVWLRNLPFVVAYELGKFFYICVREPRTLKGLVLLVRLMPRMRRKRAGVHATATLSTRELLHWFNA